MATQRLTFYLLDKEVKSFKDAVDEEKIEDASKMDLHQEINGVFYYKTSKEKIPQWVHFVELLTTERLGVVKTASASGLLLIKADRRYFAITFGYGRSLLDLSKIEYQFGLRVALNSIDHKRMRTLDTKIYDNMIISTKVQSSRNTELETFGINAATDILGSVTGQPKDSSFAKKLTGSDSLVLTMDHEIDNLPSFCTNLLEIYKRDSYRENFSWIDQLSIVKKLSEVDELNTCLLEQLKSKDISRTHLSFPDAVNWEDIDDFKIGGTKNKIYDELDIKEYLDSLDDTEELTIEKLKRYSVSVRFARNQKFDKRWNLFSCIVSEQRLNNMLYALIDGRWFRIDEDLVEQIDTYLYQRSKPTVNLIAAHKGEKEKDYNNRAAQACGEYMLNLDRQNIIPSNARSAIEFCDLLCKDGNIIHVKRETKSSTLSHLFAQGYVSASTFFKDGLFRDRLRTKISEIASEDTREEWLSIIPASGQTVHRDRYTINYAIVTKNMTKGIDWLPFFSKLNLMQHCGNLEAMGVNASFIRVPIESIEI